MLAPATATASMGWLRRTTSGTVPATTDSVVHPGLPVPSRDGRPAQVSASPRTSSAAASATSPGGRPGDVRPMTGAGPSWCAQGSNQSRRSSSTSRAGNQPAQLVTALHAHGGRAELAAVLFILQELPFMIAALGLGHLLRGRFPKLSSFG
ncbi:MAG TPA: hypothetical protein VGD91_09170, partial [Trebonia sp.]